MPQCVRCLADNKPLLVLEENNSFVRSNFRMRTGRLGLKKIFGDFRFMTAGALRKWKRTPFGPTSAPATQQRMGDLLVAETKCVSVVAYLGEIAVFSNSSEEHMGHCVGRSSLQLPSLKPGPFQRKPCYLCFPVSAQGRPDPAKRDTEHRLAPSRCQLIRRLHAVLWVVGVSTEDLLRITRMSEPLQRLMPASVAFTSGNAPEAAFDTTKDAPV